MSEPLPEPSGLAKQPGEPIAAGAPIRDAGVGLRRRQDDPGLMALEACVLAKMGQQEAAVRIMTDLETISGTRYVDPYPLAWAHLALGDKAGAFAKLREACLKKSEGVIFTDGPSGLRTDPKLHEIRNEPEFQELLKLAGMDVWPKPALGK